MGLKSSPSLAIGSTKTNISSIAFSYKIVNTVYNKIAVPVGTAPGTDHVPMGLYGAVALEIGTDGVIDVIKATDNATGYATALLAKLGIPAVSAFHVRMGYVTVTRSDSDFIFGTTFFDTALVTTVYDDCSVLYPSDVASIDQGTVDTPVNAENWNLFVDDLNAIIEDLILANGDGQAFPGTDHTANQSICMDDAMQSIRHQVAHALGETNWYDSPAGSLKIHTHAVGQGGLIPWGSLGVSNARKVELHPLYRGSLITNSLRGAAPSGANVITVTNDVDVVSYVGRHRYAGSSSSVSLQDTYVAVRFTLPVDFSAWATSNAIQIEYTTESALSSDCYVGIYIYKSGVGAVVASSENNVNTNWSNIGFSAANLGSWSANDILELYIKLGSRNDNHAKVGRIAFNYLAG